MSWHSFIITSIAELFHKQGQPEADHGPNDDNFSHLVGKVDIYEMWHSFAPIGRGATVGIRTMEEIEGVTLHQTDCALPFGSMACRRVPADFVVHRCGRITQIRPLDQWVYHAQGNRLNPWPSKGRVGIEFEGRMHGLEGNDATILLYSKDKERGLKKKDIVMPLTVKQTESGLWLLRYLKKYCRGGSFSGGNPKIFAHRQSSAMRTRCPGELVWKLVAQPMIDSGEYSCDYSWTYGDGYAIPDVWSGHRNSFGYRSR